ncbi:sulfotransferase family 2 domain-containing protein [Pseudoalteromonas luteoviolacea]|uniref:Sulfotransferase family protein n=1 Tax=Pseudoalteromonas luteoviolacea S4054 TaxID=1129367 RepID=A0A0F6AF25_9GAMM|nr:sulfotransferase family 2 domain-containing protein [Pseudoalteromonas luteoviolacea]AOT08399.1 hypothetical protein S4054249_11320 [Pseudoalteromonas luteoviolacea]AOT13315.1 hypothetical protein S40542_11295 [Pseudoalteromonas luteoviolacea]AOT18228.1 hypothetical protein S4054_11295 [Pseudoalteromonas luteoviolacea]KKE84788.1 hypothetical protein N479_00955 [Pseudoalteromonas luteoviolacea S4054]KZN76047.1 hypothetical protein N481_06770 [Pseudoalteromonas luteoviolacea S4047-1]
MDYIRLKQAAAKVVGPIYSENLVNYVRYPYSPWEDKYQCIFIHVPKTAGKSVAKCLLGAPNGTGHTKLKCYERDKVKYHRYAKVAFVRNPWDRLVSAFFYLKLNKRKDNDRKFFDFYIGKNLNFNDFLKLLEDKKSRRTVLRWQHFTPQRRFLINSSGMMDIDYLCRFENISNDYNSIKSVINPLALDLIKVNATPRSEYRKYYNIEQANLVGNIYEEDVSEFHYVF